MQISKRMIEIAAQLKGFDFLYDEDDVAELAKQYPLTYGAILQLIEEAYALLIEKANIHLELGRLSDYSDMLTWIDTLNEILWTFKAAAEKAV